MRDGRGMVSLCWAFHVADNSNTVPEYTMSRRSISNRLQVQSQPMEVQPGVPPVKQVCCFCGLPDDNELEFGKIYHYQGIVTHYYCLVSEKLI